MNGTVVIPPSDPAQKGAAPLPMREATAVHTRILRCMLAADDCDAYWRRVDLAIPLPRRAELAFEKRWFGTKSEARVRQLVSDFSARFDPFPEALALLAQLGSGAPGLRRWLCHLHLQLADPIYRAFSGVFLPTRRDQGYASIDRIILSRWIAGSFPGRWAQATCDKFAANLAVTAVDAGLLSGRRDPRSMALSPVPPEVLAYALYLLRDVQIESALVQSPYLRSLGASADTLVSMAFRIPGIRCAKVGDLLDVSYEEPSLSAWGKRYLGGLS